MVNRHLLRQKALQSLYAYFVGGEEDMASHEKFMFDSVSNLYNLEIYLFATILEIRKIEQMRIEEAQTKFYPTEEEKNPNLRFINNRFIDRLAANKELQKAITKLHINYVNQRGLFRNILNSFRRCDSYNDYMKREECTYENDRKIVCQLFKNYIMRSESLYDVLCENGFTWDSDYGYVCQIVLQYLKTWNEDESDQKPLPYPLDTTDNTQEESDEDYLRNIFRNTIKHAKEYEPYIENNSKNWDRDRLALIDVLIIKMAITEFIYCPSIPLRVSLDEYIELSKEFSTSKSRLFINGVLDRIITELRVDNKIHKDNDESLYFENSEGSMETYNHQSE